MKINKILIFGGAAGLVLGTAVAAPVAVERRVQLMGTTLRAVVEARTRDEALSASELAIAAIAAAEARLSTWTASSELSRFNAEPAGTPVHISRLLVRDLKAALRCVQRTDGAFHPGLGRLVAAWGLRTGGRQPAEGEIEALLPALDVTQLHVERDWARRPDERFTIEEGGFGKGVALDDAIASLRGGRATGAVLDFGGQVVVWRKATTTVDIADPRDRDRVVLHAHIPHGSVATSGNSERGIVVAGQRLGHLLDPRTGHPAPDFGSMTVWAASGVASDCLATGLFVLGPLEAVRRASRSREFELIVLEVSGERLVAHASAGFAGRLEPCVDDLVVHWIER